MKRPTFEQRYPTQRAREVADRAIDDLPEDAPMTTYIDTWLEAYARAGGLVRR